MVRTREDSVMEIWPEDYLNCEACRQDKDIDVEILQVQYAYSDRFIVEFVRKKDYETYEDEDEEPDIDFSPQTEDERTKWINENWRRK